MSGRIPRKMVALGTKQEPGTVVYDTNSTDATFDSRVATVTRPNPGDETGAYKIGETDNWVRIILYGVGNADTTFNIRVILWEKVEADPTVTGEVDLYVPIVYTFSCTLGAATGVANTPINASQKFVDTITKTTGPESVVVFSPADDTVAYIDVDPRGCDFIQVDFDMTGATSGNAVIRGF